MLEGLTSWLELIGEQIGLIFRLLTNGFQIIRTFFTIPNDSLMAFMDFSDYFPPYLWIPVLLLTLLCLLLRIWNVITSGGK